MGDAMLATLRVMLPLGYFLAGCTWLFWLWYFLIYILPNTAMETGRERRRSLLINCTTGIASVIVIAAMFPALREFMTWSDLQRDKMLEGKRPEWLGPASYSPRQTAQAPPPAAESGSDVAEGADVQPQQTEQPTPSAANGLNDEIDRT